jgi:prepilin-type N-terminal cleavage/methylation domain-containing protein
MKTHAKNHQAGFTLIEFIVGLVIAAIIAAMVYTYFGTALTQSGVPIQRLQKASKLHQVMENIVADYNRLNALNLRYTWRTGIDYHVGSVVVPSINKNNGHYYTCTTTGTSGAEPTTWPTGAGAPVSDGGVTWREGGIIWTASGPLNETIVWRQSQLYSANDIMIPINNDGHYYRCTTSHTTSSSALGSVIDTWKNSKSYIAGDTVSPTSYNGHYYICTTAGTSGATQPPWPSSGPVTDNTVTWTEAWTEAGTILARTGTTASNNDAVLNDNIWNYLNNYASRYGTGYTVVTAETKFIKFSGTNEADAVGADEKNILKVTIRSDDTNETLTQLFTIR